VIEICRIPVFLENVNACLNGEKRESIIQFDEDFYNVLYNPVHDEDVLNGAVLLFIDVSERYAAERHRKEFSANVSHELKTPITSIAAYSEMIADGTVKEEDVKPFAAKINNQAKRLIEIINDIIKLSEFDEGEKSKAFSEVNLYKLAETVINNLQEKASQQNVSLSLVGEKALTVNGNPLLLDEMLFNLIDNAIKYNKAGGEVSIELTSSADSAKVVVKDSGIGIPKAHLPHIFERFYRVDKSRSKKTGGTGLGLSIVKHIAEFHGGSVEVESEENVGSIFTCLIAKNRHEPDG
jgi:two-component system phosphate regulon sensor histidine kinase PhoR